MDEFQRYLTRHYSRLLISARDNFKASQKLNVYMHLCKINGPLVEQPEFKQYRDLILIPKSNILKSSDIPYYFYFKFKVKGDCIYYKAMKYRTCGIQ